MRKRIKIAQKGKLVAYLRDHGLSFTDAIAIQCGQDAIIAEPVRKAEIHYLRTATGLMTSRRLVSARSRDNSSCTQALYDCS